MNALTLRKRLKTLREQAKYSQQELAAKLGFNDRQTLQAIESGERKLAAEELVKAAEIFDVDLSFFTDPFLLAGEGRFSWRQNSNDHSSLDQYEQLAGRWIASFRHLRELQKEPASAFSRKVGLSRDSSYEEASRVGEQIAEELNLGKIPAGQLISRIQDELGILVLHVDAVQGISGAACQLNDLSTILINRNESDGRRIFDCAHELFHLLTWDALPPQHQESLNPTGTNKHIEKLAENFAASLLMPRRVVEPLLESRKDYKLHDWLNASADCLGVSAQAFKWRMVNLRVLSQREAKAVPDELLVNNGKTDFMDDDIPPLYSHLFMSTIAWGIEEGHLSVRKAARVLNLTIDELRLLLDDYGIKPPFEL